MSSPGDAAILPLEGALKRYAWGSLRAIPELLGREADGRPWAELWLGAHPQAPATAATRAGRRVPLDALIAGAPEAILGDRVARRFGRELPFLFKVLAAAEPLSIQCHPSAEQAAAGFEREERAGIPRDAPERSYRDRSPKPELIVALTRFAALKGFRPPEEIRARIAAAGVEALAPELELLGEEDGLRRFFSALIALGAPRRAGVLAELQRGFGASASPEAVWVGRLLERYPGDLGALAPLYLQLVELEPGQALFLPARELHAYLEGVGLEIMASSDNVLRGGLTEKHVDTAELVRVLRFETGDAAPLCPRAEGPLRVFSTPATEFQLAYADLVEGAPLDRGPREAVEILLVSEGDLRVLTPEGVATELRRGNAALAPAALPRYRLEGRGRVWFATVPT